MEFKNIIIVQLKAINILIAIDMANYLYYLYIKTIHFELYILYNLHFLSLRDLSIRGFNSDIILLYSFNLLTRALMNFLGSACLMNFY